METYIVYVADGTVLGAVEAQDTNHAAESVVNGHDWSDDTAAVEVNVARVLSDDYDVPDTLDPTDDAVEVEKTGVKAAVHN